MTDTATLRNALSQVQRGLSVAKLGLARDGAQYAKLVQLEEIIAVALAAPSLPASPSILEDAIAFIESLTAVPLLMGDDIEMRLEDVHAHAEVEAASLRKRMTKAPATPSVSVESEAGISIEALQAAHVARQEEWCPDQKPDLSFRGNEMAGEVGEACNVIKKLERERQGWRGSRATVDDLGGELADVIHTAILCSITAGIELGPRVIAKFNATSEKNGLATTISAAPAPNPSPAAKGGEAGVERLVDELACWMHGEVDWPDQNSGRSWPEHDEDTGARGNNAYVTLVHMDAVHQWRDIARRMVKGFRLEQSPRALATPSPQPADAVREALTKLVSAANAMGDACNSNICDEALAEARAALTEPAPAGEAVEPIEKHRIANRLRGMFDMSVASADDFNRLSPAGFRLLRQAHDALIDPEDTARLREDLERVEVKAWLVGHPATGQWIEVDGRRVEYARGLGTPAGVLAQAFKVERDRADTAERERNIARCERDDARKALDALTEALTPSGDTKADYAGEFFEEIEFPNPEYDEDDEDSEDDETVLRRVYIQWETIKEIMNAIKVRAARSASREAIR